MKRSLRSMMISISVILISFALSITVFAASTTYVYNGNTTSGWSSGGGSMNVLQGYGYNGSMYWQYTSTANSQGTIGHWMTGYWQGSTGFYVYVPNGGHATATVNYGISYGYLGSGWNTLSLNQSSYSNVWIYLGTYAVDSGSGNGISAPWGTASGGSYVGWDDVKYVH